MTLLDGQSESDSRSSGENCLPSEFVIAFRGSWIIVSLVLLAVLVASFVVDPRTLDLWVPSCWAKATGHQCLFCGMTRGFIYISAGRLNQALLLNSGSVALYVVFVTNTVLCGIMCSGVLANRQERETKCAAE